LNRSSIRGTSGETLSRRPPAKFIARPANFIASIGGENPLRTSRCLSLDQIAACSQKVIALKCRATLLLHEKPARRSLITVVL
jgi:hypothetical protein